MAQPSISQYFNTRKRSAVEDHKINLARKVLVLDSDTYQNKNNNVSNLPEESKIIYQSSNTQKTGLRKKCFESASKVCANQPPVILSASKNNKKERKGPTLKTKKANEGNKDIKQLIDNMGAHQEAPRCVTPEPQPIQDQPKSIDLAAIKKKLTRSEKLAELKASITRFKELDNGLKQAEKRTATITSSSGSPKLKTFSTLEFEVVSPQKVTSPEKPYLSPRKEPSVCRRVLSSPVKKTLTFPSSPIKSLDPIAKTGLKLPYKYRTLAEIFRAIDTISQILHNRNELITFKKLKNAVERMLKRTLHEKHLAQVKHIYPEAFTYCQKKVKQFNCGPKKEDWELVLTPNLEGQDTLTPEIILNRRRKLFSNLIEKIKIYHDEFLQSLDPPMHIPKDKITAWHPEFDLEKVPDIELADVPQAPIEEKFQTGQEVFAKAREMFNCNTRMEKALAMLREKREKSNAEKTGEVAVTPGPPVSILKGIPQALLEKVREKQAAKALMLMTRSADQSKEVQIYSRLPVLAKHMRNLFVTEKKGVLLQDFVVEKLRNSLNSTLNKAEMEEHLKIMAKEVPDWLVFHNIRNTVFLKLMKNADMGVVLKKLENSAKIKSET